MSGAECGRGRRVLVERLELGKLAGRWVRLEVGGSGDRPRVLDFMKENFALREPMLRHHGVDPELFSAVVLRDVVEESLRSPYSVLAFEGDRLVGCHLVALKSVDMTQPRPCATPPADFSQLYYIMSLLPNFLPDDRPELLVGSGEMASVDKEFEGNGLFKAMLAEVVKQLHMDGVEWYFAIATGAASNLITSRMGAEHVWHILYKDIYDKDTPMFGASGVLSDGNDRISLALGRTKDMAEC